MSGVEAVIDYDTGAAAPTAEEKQESQKTEQEPRPVIAVEPTQQKSPVVVRPPCALAKAQAPIQACLRPSMWLPGVRNLHFARETWEIKASVTEAIDSIVAGIQDMETTREHLDLHKVDRKKNYIEIFSYTVNCSWLDVVEIHFRTGTDPDITQAEVLSFSSGLIPVWMPLSFLSNIWCCCFPFSGNGMNTKRIEAIRESVQLSIKVTAETKCNCCPS